MAMIDRMARLDCRFLLAALGAAAFFGGGTTWQLSAAPPSTDAPRPDWVWAAGPRDASQQVTLRRVFELPNTTRRVTVEAIADSADAQLRINGHTAGRWEPYRSVAEWDVTEWIQPGKNRLAISAQGVGGAAAVALRLTWLDDQGQSHTLLTDRRWQSGAGPAASYGRVGQVLWQGNRGPVRLSPLEDYAQWKRALQPGQVTDPSTFIAPPGFEIELLRAARPDEGSWVAMAFDREGRLTVAREERGLLRLSFGPDRQNVTAVEPIDETLQECRGLLYADGHLYANANNSKALFRLSDTTGDDSFDQIEQLYASDGGVGHGRNDLTLGPDQHLYAIHGDAVKLPRNFVDRTSPAREHRRGESTREGHLLRIPRDGSRGEILSAGLRNPFGIAVNRHGEAFSYDADAEYDMGAPWYRPTRVNHLVSGSDFGWRGVTGDWPPYYPDHCDNAPPILNVGRGSPTAVTFATGSNFPPPYDDALFILDWAYGRVMAVQMEPRGSSYACLGETFVQGRPLNVTDLEFGPDGSMYLITGGRKTQSALYRIRYTGEPCEPTDPTPQQQARRQGAQHARSRRQMLERYLGEQDTEALEVAWRALGEADPWLRHVARTVVEHQPPSSWAERALREARPSHAAIALLALARCDASGHGRQIAQRLSKLPIDSLPPRTQIAALYTGWLCLQAFPDDASVHRALQTLLADRYPSRAAIARQRQRWNLWASRILVRIAPQQAVPATVERLRHSRDQQQQLHYLFVLRSATQGWTMPARRLFFERLADAEYFEGGAGMPEFLAHIRAEALATLSDPERTALADVLEAEHRDVLPSGPPRTRVRRWSLEGLETALTEQDGRGNRERGERLFVEAKCAACHRFAGHGRPLGPDLTHVARRFSRRDLLKSILHPSDVIAENYRNLQIVTEAGRVHIGRALAAGDFREPTVRLVADLTHPEDVTEIEKRNIAESRPSPISPMPEGLFDVLTAEEILDLLSFLQSARAPSQGNLPAP